MDSGGHALGQMYDNHRSTTISLVPYSVRGWYLYDFVLERLISSQALRDAYTESCSIKRVITELHLNEYHDLEKR